MVAEICRVMHLHDQSARKYERVGAYERLQTKREFSIGI
jgi:hypothetical protein